MKVERIGTLDRRGKASALRVRREDREQRTAWSIAKELKLAVLIDRADRVYGCRALTVLAETLGPELAPPTAQRRELVGI